MFAVGRFAVGIFAEGRFAEGVLVAGGCVTPGLPAGRAAGLAAGAAGLGAAAAGRGAGAGAAALVPALAKLDAPKSATTMSAVEPLLSALQRVGILIGSSFPFSISFPRFVHPRLRYSTLLNIRFAQVS
jgi:hypothetical protein